MPLVNFFAGARFFHLRHPHPPHRINAFEKPQMDFKKRINKSASGVFVHIHVSAFKISIPMETFERACCGNFLMNLLHDAQVERHQHFLF
jgi:hypothetical protein